MLFLDFLGKIAQDRLRRETSHQKQLQTQRIKRAFIFQPDFSHDSGVDSMSFGLSWYLSFLSVWQNTSHSKWRITLNLIGCTQLLKKHRENTNRNQRNVWLVMCKQCYFALFCTYLYHVRITLKLYEISRAWHWVLPACVVSWTGWHLAGLTHGTAVLLSGKGTRTATLDTTWTNKWIHPDLSRLHTTVRQDECRWMTTKVS